MSGLTDEWLLKISENCIKYVIDIDNFNKKIKTFRPGREIHSKHFKIGRSIFCIDIYPAGKTSDNKGSVSIFLVNRSFWRVKAKAKISIPGRGFTESISEEYFQPSKGWGFGSFVTHSRCTTDDLLSNDSGMITFQVDVELLEEEVLPGRDLSKENTMERIEKLETTIQNMETKNERQTNELKKMIQDLTLTLSNNLRSSQQRSSLDVECPVCMESVRPPMRLKQCGQGHIICDTCHARAEKEAKEASSHREGNPRIDHCHTCRDVITGRPSELERILGLTDQTPVNHVPSFLHTIAATCLATLWQ